MHEHRLIFRQNCIVSVTIPERRTDPLSIAKRRARAALMQQRTTYTNGTMSAATSRKLKSVAECYLQSIYYRRDAQQRAGVPLSSVPAFITLTYPAPVQHTHEHTKRKHLTPFLSYLTRAKNCGSYIWRAELQQNGNIHFHIFTHRFIEWKWVRATWNNILSTDGYIQQFAAKHGHTNPNSTDVEMIRDLDRAAAYVAKYITKTPLSNSGIITGRQYGMSDNVRKICKHYHISNEDAHAFQHAVWNSGIDVEVKKINDFASLLFFEKNTREVLMKSDMSEFKMYRQHYVNVASQLRM